MKINLNGGKTTDVSMFTLALLYENTFIL